MNKTTYIDRPVYQIWGGDNVRFGIATDEKIGDDGWRYVTVGWQDNELYERVQVRQDVWIRCDKLRLFDPGSMIQVLRKIR